MQPSSADVEVRPMNDARSDETMTTDVLVIGSGASGMTAAITARILGLDVILVEKDAVFGGTTAWSGGVAWIPCNSHMRAAGITDDIELARRYIAHEAGPCYDDRRVDAFLRGGAAMVDFLEQHTAVQFQLAHEPDYHPDAAGALPLGRALQPVEFDGRKLGPLFASLRKPPRQRVLFWGLQIGGAHLSHFLNFTRSLESFLFVSRRIGLYVADVLRYGHSVRSMMGNALAARLGHALQRLDIPMLLSTPAQRLIRGPDRLEGAIVHRDGRPVRISAGRGVVLACGGFAHDVGRRQHWYPHHPAAGEHLSNAPESIVGDGLNMAEAVGGATDRSFVDAAVWYPTSRVAYPDGTEGNNAHLLERGKPGFIAVTPQGSRFVNEALNYHDFVKAMMKASPQGEPVAACFVCDHKAMRRYGIGAVKPWPMPYRGFIRTGYLKRGRTIEELAHAAGIHAPTLAKTVAAYNADARLGRDLTFGKGQNAYDVAQGDPTHLPNPCVGPLDAAPFYAVRIVPGDLSTLAGLKTDAEARVLDAAGDPIPGLYAVGNDQASLFGGSYPGGGATIGPAMTFGFIAGRHLAGVPGG